MTVIAFRPRPAEPSAHDEVTAISGVFRSPRGRQGVMTGQLRLRRIVVIPRGVFVRGVFTGELREPDGTLVGVDSRRCTVPADLRRDDDVLRAVVRPVRLDLMGITVEISSFAVVPELTLPPAPTRADGGRWRAHRRSAGMSPL